jgi:hypothetical protein
MLKGKRFVVLIAEASTNQEPYVGILINLLIMKKFRFKFNSGSGAVVCNNCNKIIATELTQQEFTKNKYECICNKKTNET